MKRVYSLLAGFLALMVATTAFGQSPYRNQPKPTTRQSITKPEMQTGISGLLDPSRITMSQQFGMGYTTVGGRGYTQGYYLNNLTYRFNAPVLLKLHLGATNNPFAQSNPMPGQSSFSSVLANAEFFGGADLIWKPREDMKFQLSFYQMPSSYYYNPYGYRSGLYSRGYSPWGFTTPMTSGMNEFQP